jgi:hypothetical protein
MRLRRREMAVTLEQVALATIEARIFLDRVRPRTLKTDGGRIVTTEEVARALVRAAQLEHAVLPGKRPRNIICGCGALVKVSQTGSLPTQCQRCRVKNNTARINKYRQANPGRHLAKNRERGKKWRQANAEKRRDAKRRYRAALKASRRQHEVEG